MRMISANGLLIPALGQDAWYVGNNSVSKKYNLSVIQLLLDEYGGSDWMWRRLD
ncbi:MAG: hypothetical protein LBG12_10375 [Synergistaceae bacterium]|nr:hypothetical protein [Synergistaceae bacterium]